jgi:hypothetical protein
MSKPSSSKKSRTLSTIEPDLEDRDCQIFDPITSFDLYELHKLYFDRYNQLHDYFHAWESNLARFIVPQTYNFP